MDTLLAIVFFALSLFGIDIGSQTRIDHIRSNGTDILYSKVVAKPAVTRFECVRSASGRCYYTVYPRDCMPKAGATPASASARSRHCQSRPIERFALAKGDSRQVSLLRGIDLCVSAEAGNARADCVAPDTAAAQ
jgi:hypothetical protein